MKHRHWLLIGATLLLVAGLGGWAWYRTATRNKTLADVQILLQLLQTNIHLNGMSYKLDDDTWVFLKSDDLLRIERRFINEEGNHVTDYRFRTLDGQYCWANSFSGYTGLLTEREDMAYFNVNYFLDWLASRVIRPDSQLSVTGKQYRYEDDSFTVECRFNQADEIAAYTLWRKSDEHGEPAVSVVLLELNRSWQSTGLFVVPDTYLNLDQTLP